MVQQMGGSVTSSEKKEFGRANIKITENCILFEDIWMPGESHQVWMSHGDEIENLGLEFDVIGISSNNVIGAIRHKERPFYGELTDFMSSGACMVLALEKENAVLLLKIWILSLMLDVDILRQEQVSLYI